MGSNCFFERSGVCLARDGRAMTIAGQQGVEGSVSVYHLVADLAFFVPHLFPPSTFGPKQL